MVGQETFITPLIGGLVKSAPAMNYPAFETFQHAHLGAIAACVVASIVIPLAFRRIEPTLRRRLEVGMAFAILIFETSRLISKVVVFGIPWQYSLPLQICGVSVYLVVFLLLRPNQVVYELVYFWGLGGAFQGILTPDLIDSFPHPYFIAYFISHGVIVLGALYATLVFGMRPRWRSVPRVFLITLVYAFGIVAPLDHLLGVNYLYLCAKPSQASIIDYLGPWPWYIASLTGVAMASYVVYYLPFAVADWFRRPAGRIERDSRDTDRGAQGTVAEPASKC